MLLDHHHAALFTLEELQLWLAHRLDWIASLLVLLTALLCVLNRDSVAPAATGLAISNSLQALVFFTWVRDCEFECCNSRRDCRREFGMLGTDRISCAAVVIVIFSERTGISRLSF